VRRIAECVSSSKKAMVVDWYHERGTRSHAERGVAWDRPVGELVSFALRNWVER
jgi:hypothetical protein